MDEMKTAAVLFRFLDRGFVPVKSEVRVSARPEAPTERHGTRAHPGLEEERYSHIQAGRRATPVRMILAFPEASRLTR